jgi:hypothetical protein
LAEKQEYSKLLSQLFKFLSQLPKPFHIRTQPKPLLSPLFADTNLHTRRNPSQPIADIADAPLLFTDRHRPKPNYRLAFTYPTLPPPITPLHYPTKSTEKTSPF